jgi:VWFA-related protein
VVVSLANGERLVQTLRTKAAEATFRSQIAAVQIPVTVKDGRRFVGGLPEQAFRIYENDRPEQLVGFIAHDVPLELVIAIDTSASVKADMPAIKAAAAELLSAIPSKQPVTILAFNDQVISIAARQTEPVLRLQALEKLEPWGGTAFYDAVILGLHTFRQQAGRKVLVVFTDGEDQGSRTTFADAQRRVGETEALVYMVGTGRALEREAFRREMRTLSEPTGGRAIFTDDIEKLRDAFRELVQEFSTQYLLSYVPSNPAQDGTWRRIKVAVNGHSDVRARQGYRASPTPTR